MDLRYPTTRYEPPPVVELSTTAERDRLSPAAIKAFLNIVEKWGVQDEGARALLGGVSKREFYQMKTKLRRTLSVDTITRISYLVGIFKGLNILYSKKD
jgi:Antitoxin Xre-like helix-turn-helix domain